MYCLKIMRDIPVDVVISTYRRGCQIDRTIASICQSAHWNFNLWVFDQSENDLTEKCVARYVQVDPRVHYHRMPLRGLAPTRNVGSTFGSAPYILFTNDDCIVAPNWIEALIQEFRAPETWFVFGRVLPGDKPDSTEISPNVRHNEQVVLALKETPWREVYKNNRFNLAFGHGHNMAVRREHFQTLCGFDELLGAGGPLGSWDERDIGYRALRRGGQIVYTPDATVYHCHWQTWEGVQQSYRNYGIGTGAAVAKYMRSGDVGAIALFIEWLLSQGIRQTLSGAIKWRSMKKVLVGLSQLYYPWVGFAKGLRYPVDSASALYRSNHG